MTPGDGTTALALLSFSAVFDTIDHDILLDCLQEFTMGGTVLFLPPRSFIDNVDLALGLSYVGYLIALFAPYSYLIST